MNFFSRGWRLKEEKEEVVVEEEVVSPNVCNALLH